MEDDDDLFETISPDASPEAFQEGSEGEPPVGVAMVGLDDDDNGFEEISSEEEPYLSDSDTGIGMVSVCYLLHCHLQPLTGCWAASCLSGGACYSGSNSRLLSPLEMTTVVVVVVVVVGHGSASPIS